MAARNCRGSGRRVQLAGIGASNPANLAWVAPLVLGVGSLSLLEVESKGIGSELGPASCDAGGWLGGSGIFPTSVGSSAQLARNSINIAI